MAITLLLIDDHTLIRKGLRALLETEPDLQVVGEAPDGRTGILLALDLSPDVVLTNMSMPDLNGIEVTRQIAAGAPGVKVVVLSMEDDEFIRRESLNAGASAYLVKGCRVEDLLAAIRAAAKA